MAKCSRCGTEAEISMSFRRLCPRCENEARAVERLMAMIDREKKDGEKERLRSASKPHSLSPSS